MNWTVNDAVLQADASTWLAGPQSSFLTTTTSPTAWDSVCLKVVYKSEGGCLYIDLDPWYLAIEEPEGRVTLSKYARGNLLEAWDIERCEQGERTVDVSAVLSSITVTVNGQEFNCHSAVPTPMTSTGLHFTEGVRFCHPQLSVHEITMDCEASVTAESRKSLEFTVDFYDDVQLTPFNQEMLDEMFRAMARLNTSLAYWIHHGPRGNGFWEGGTAVDNLARSFDQLGNDFLPPAVESAHQAGIPLIGILKPFDTAILHTTNSVLGVSRSADALGGKLEMGFDFPAAHPELCMRRRTSPRAGKRPAQLLIRSRRDLPTDAADHIEISVSDDNASYRPYLGYLAIEVNGREIRVSGLSIKEEFFVLAFSPALAAHIQNTLPLLAELRDEDDVLLEFTYGIAPRLRWTGEYHLDSGFEYLPFKEHGLNFDCAGHGVPSALWNSRRRQLELFSPTISYNVLGFAMNGNTHIPAILSEAEPGAHAWWLSSICEMLDAGVDGIEIRMSNHSNIIDWSLFGFNPPLVEEYRRRYGIDITTDEFSLEKFRALRGEFFTSFLRQASELVRSHGKQFHLHIEDTYQGPASEPCPMDIAMPWREWIEERICDAVTLKALNPWSNDTAFGREVIASCHAQGIPVSFSPFIHSAFLSEHKNELLSSYLSSSYDAFNFYEFATLIKFTPQGEVEYADQSMLTWLNNYDWSLAVAHCEL
jgi:hypothetical protein